MKKIKLEKQKMKKCLFTKILAIILFMTLILVFSGNANTINTNSGSNIKYSKLNGGGVPYDNGVFPDITYVYDNDKSTPPNEKMFIEVHASATDGHTGDLYYHIGKVDQNSNVTWSQSKLIIKTQGTEVQPKVTYLGDNKVLLMYNVHVGPDIQRYNTRFIKCAIGTLNRSDYTIKWDFQKLPHSIEVQTDSSDVSYAGKIEKGHLKKRDSKYAIMVYSLGQGQLFYKLGRLVSNDNKIYWGAKQNVYTPEGQMLGNADKPSVGFINLENNEIALMYVTKGSDALNMLTGKLCLGQDGTATIKWIDDKIGYDKGFIPSVASFVTDTGGNINTVEVHKSQNNNDLWTNTAVVNETGIFSGRGDYLKYDLGNDPSVEGLGDGRVLELHGNSDENRLFYELLPVGTLPQAKGTAHSL